MAKTGEAIDILETLDDFTSKENWDKFFTLRGSGDSFEWYSEWPSLSEPLIAQLSSVSSPSSASSLQILVPGCGSSRLSEHLYDAGFHHVTNIDFSKVVVSDMLRRHVRSRPEMRWRVMDMTDMQFADEFFDVILDKGGLDALMEPEVGKMLGSKYLKEVKRVLKLGGKFLCLTLAESHVLGLLFSEFRFGWETSVHAVPNKLLNKPNFQTFLVAIVKGKLGVLNQIASPIDTSSNCNAKQMHALVDAVKNENKIRSEYSPGSGSDTILSLEDLKLGAKGDLKEFCPGQRLQLILGELGASIYSYKAVLLDSRPQPDSFLYGYGIFIVPKARAHEWLFTSEEGQWLVVESTKAARLIMVFLDSRHSHASMDIVKKDLSPLVKSLAPGKDDDEALIPFLTADDGVKQRDIVKQVTSMITGPIIVEDVIYENVDGSNANISPSQDMFRRLIFERSSGLVQSEAFLTREESESNFGEAERKRSNASLKSHRKGGRKRSDSRMLNDGSKYSLKVDHSRLASSYHSGIISGFALIASILENMDSLQRKVKTVIVGLGAGLLPMLLHGCLPFLDIEVVELDPLVLDIARDYFGFKEDKQLKVYIGDGIEFIKNVKDDTSSNMEAYDGKSTESITNGNYSTGYKILIIDADSSDLSSGLTCPHVEFVEEPFLLIVKEFLSNGGLFVINLVSRSLVIRDTVVSRMKTVFGRVFSLELEEDVNEVLFATHADDCIDAEPSPESMARLRSLLKVSFPDGQIEKWKFKCLK